MAYCVFIPFLVFLSTQVTSSAGLIACTYHFYSYGKKRLKTIYCDEWEYCCSGSCCQSTLDIYRLWYFWIGIFLLTLVCITISFTWFKKYQGRVIRVGPQTSNQLSIETVITQYAVQPHLHAGTYTVIPHQNGGQFQYAGPSGPPPPPAGPPPPYQQLSTYPKLPQYTQYAPAKQGYAVSASIDQNNIQPPPF